MNANEIYIADQVLAGNMGEGWIDEAGAANAYAAFLESEYLAMATARFPGAEIEVEIDVQNASGCSRDAVVVGGDAIDWKAMSDLERDLCDSDFWSKWLDSDDAAKYLDEMSND